jgi:hypothetical protein
VIDLIYPQIFCDQNQFELLRIEKEGFDMAVSAKYGKLSIPKVGDDEPVFVLRAQDKLAEFAMSMYQALAASHGASVAIDIHKEIESFRKWKGTKKLPD